MGDSGVDHRLVELAQRGVPLTDDQSAQEAPIGLGSQPTDVLTHRGPQVPVDPRVEGRIIASQDRDPVRTRDAEVDERVVSPGGGQAVELSGVGGRSEATHPPDELHPLAGCEVVDGFVYARAQKPADASVSLVSAQLLAAEDEDGPVRAAVTQGGSIGESHRRGNDPSAQGRQDAGLTRIGHDVIVGGGEVAQPKVKPRSGEDRGGDAGCCDKTESLSGQGDQREKQEP